MAASPPRKRARGSNDEYPSCIIIVSDEDTTSCSSIEFSELSSLSPTVIQDNSTSQETLNGRKSKLYYLRNFMTVLNCVFEIYPHLFVEPELALHNKFCNLDENTQWLIPLVLWIFTFTQSVCTVIS